MNAIDRKWLNLLSSNEVNSAQPLSDYSTDQLRDLEALIILELAIRRAEAINDSENN